MKYTYLLLATLLCIQTPAYAQKNIRGGKAIVKAALSSSPSRSAGGKNLSGNLLSKAARAFSPAALAKPSALKRSIAQAALRRPAKPKADGSIFQAVSADNPDMHFSGTVFSIIYNGKKEIYGVIATHAMATDDNPLSGIGRHFIAQISTPEGTIQSVEAKIEVLSGINTLDLALVSFSKQAEPYLRPYPLGEIIPNSPLHSFGYNSSGATYTPGRKILRKTPLTVVTSMPLNREERAGLCGSAVLNEQDELVGIHTGSAVSVLVTQDYSYATHAFYLKFLVEALHNNGKGTFPLALSSDISIDVNIEDHIESIQLLNSSQQVLWNYDFIGKLSMKKIQQALSHYPQGKFLKITARPLKWQADEKTLADNVFCFTEPNIYLYDLQNHRLATP